MSFLLEKVKEYSVPFLSSTKRAKHSHLWMINNLTPDKILFQSNAIHVPSVNGQPFGFQLQVCLSNDKNPDDEYAWMRYSILYSPTNDVNLNTQVFITGENRDEFRLVDMQMNMNVFERRSNTFRLVKRSELFDQEKNFLQNRTDLSLRVDFDVEDTSTVSDNDPFKQENTTDVQSTDTQIEPTEDTCSDSDSNYDNHLGNFLEFLNKEEFSDITIQVGDEQIRAHKLLLAAASPKLRTHFRANKKLTSFTFVDRPNYTYDLVMAMLRYIYTGEPYVPSRGCNLFDFLFLAREFELADLEDEIESTMTRDLNLDNVLLYLSFAADNDCEELRFEAVLFIKEHYKEISATEKWEVFVNEKPNLVELIGNQN